MIVNSLHREPALDATHRPDRLDALTSIRIVFATMVVGTHFAGMHGGAVPGWVGPLGELAVSWFFILSGFILAYNFPVLPDWSSRGIFVVSRFWRLFPVQAVTLFASCVMFESSRYLASVDKRQLFQSLALLHDWFASPFSTQAFNVPAWSISVEWFFYLLFPFLIWRSRILALPLTILCAAAALLWANAHGCWTSYEAFVAPGDSRHPTCFSIMLYWPPARVWEFTLGIGLCSVSTVLRRLDARGWIQGALVLGAVVLFWNLDRLSAAVGTDWIAAFFAKRLLGAAAGGLLILGLSLRGPVASLLSFKFLIFAGEISFSVYMTHMLILRYANEHRIGADWPVLIQFVGSCILIAGLSAMLFSFVERPSRQMLKGIIQRVRALSIPGEHPRLRPSESLRAK